MASQPQHKTQPSLMDLARKFNTTQDMECLRSIRQSMELGILWAVGEWSKGYRFDASIKPEEFVLSYGPNTVNIGFRADRCYFRGYLTHHQDKSAIIYDYWQAYTLQIVDEHQEFVLCAKEFETLVGYQQVIQPTYRDLLTILSENSKLVERTGSLVFTPPVWKRTLGKYWLPKHRQEALRR
jgi:hypothetical protein